jgi:hypothetical protein
MNTKGKIRSGGAALARYVMTGKDGELVQVIETRGFEEFGKDPVAAFDRMEQWAAENTKCRTAFFHGHIRVAPNERLTDAQWMKSVDRMEKRLGFEGQPRIVSFHIDAKTGEKHLHVAWCRVDFENQRAIDPGLYKNKLVQLSRTLEREFCLRELSSRRPPDQARAAERDEHEQSKRLGTNVQAIRNTILNCLEQADGGKSFKAALAEKNLMLANGDRRDCFVVIDHAGGHHALNKKLTGMTLAAVRERLSDLDRTQLPSVEQAQAMQRDVQAARAMQEAHRAAQGRTDEIRPAARGRYADLQPPQPAPATKEFGATAARATEQPAPIYDRDAANRAADEKIIDAAIVATQKHRQRPEPTQEAEKHGGGAEPAQAPPKAERELSGAAADIRMAWSMSRTASELEDALASRGISLAVTSAEEARASQRTAAFAKEVGNYARLLREGEIVAVTDHGNVYRLDERTTGSSQPEIEGQLAGIDRMALLSVTDTKDVMLEAAHEIWKAARAAEREEIRPASWIEQRIADCAEQAARTGASVVVEEATGRRVDRIEALADQFRPDEERQTKAATAYGLDAFASRLEDAGIAIVRVTDTDAKALDALRHDESMAQLAAWTNNETCKGNRFAEVLPGELAAVTRNGDVYRLNPDKFTDAQRYLDCVDVLPGVVETRARFEIEREQTDALWNQRRADIADDRTAFAAERESSWQQGQSGRDMRQVDQELGDALDTGDKAASRISSSFAAAAEAILSEVFSFVDFFAPKLTPDQAERQARANEERAEARERNAEAQAQDAAQDWLLAQQRKQQEEQEAEAASRERAGRERERERDQH